MGNATVYGAILGFGRVSYYVLQPLLTADLEKGTGAWNDVHKAKKTSPANIGD